MKASPWMVLFFCIAAVACGSSSLPSEPASPTPTASGSTAVSIVATTTGGTFWTYVPNSVKLKVGQPYVITWSTVAAEATVHGMGGLAVLGITDCDAITATAPCVRPFTPTAGQVGPHAYACTNVSCGTAEQHNGMTATLTIELP